METALRNHAVSAGILWTNYSFFSFVVFLIFLTFCLLSFISLFYFLYVGLIQYSIYQWNNIDHSRECQLLSYLIPIIDSTWIHNRIIQQRIYQITIEKVALDGSYRRVLWCASATMVWPWTLTFWPQNLIGSSLSRDAPVTKVWRKSVNRYWRYRGNIKPPGESRTDGQRHGRTTRKHITSAGAYRRRRLKNS